MQSGTHIKKLQKHLCNFTGMLRPLFGPSMLENHGIDVVVGRYQLEERSFATALKPLPTSTPPLKKIGDKLCIFLMLVVEIWRGDL